MKIVVINKMLKPEHRDRITEIACRIGAEVCFTESENDLPSGFESPVTFCFASISNIYNI